MRHFALLVALLSYPLGHATANETTPAAQPLAKSTAPSRIKAVTSVAPGQAAYVHYFLLTHPDGGREYHVGIELADQRIAWSFPTAGVMVSDFIQRGTLEVKGKPFRIKHLYGIRPAPADADMPALQKNLTARVAQWVDDATPYCVIRQPGEPFCLNCGDFVIRVLYPGAHPLTPALPREFAQAKGGGVDDLLMYLVGLHEISETNILLAALATLDIPKALRQDIAAMMEGRDLDLDNPAPTSIATRPATAPAAPKPAAALPVVPGKMATRRQQARRL